MPQNKEHSPEWSVDEIERALQSDTLNETGIHDIKKFLEADKAVLKSEILDFIKQYECSLGDLPKELSDLKKKIKGE